MEVGRGKVEPLDTKDFPPMRLRNEHQEQILYEILADMDLPEQRRDFYKPENVRWLLRNIALRNRDHEGFSAAIAILRKLRPR